MHRNETGDCRKKKNGIMTSKEYQKEVPFLSTFITQLSYSYMHPFLKVQFLA